MELERGLSHEEHSMLFQCIQIVFEEPVLGDPQYCNSSSRTPIPSPGHCGTPTPPPIHITCVCVCMCVRAHARVSWLPCEGQRTTLGNLLSSHCARNWSHQVVLQVFLLAVLSCWPDFQQFFYFYLLTCCCFIFHYVSLAGLELTM